MSKSPQTTAPAAAPETKPAQPEVKVDTRQLKSTYCNVCNASSTREEVVLNFGINQNWDIAQNERSSFDIELHHRIILNPHAAKRLHQILGQLLNEHETRYGELK